MKNTVSFSCLFPYLTGKRQKILKNQGLTILSYLIADKNFRDLVVDPNDVRNFYLEKWIDEHPGSLAEVKKARKFIETMTFKKEELLPFELDELFEKIIACENPVLQSKPF
jgi:hypothetical protein